MIFYGPLVEAIERNKNTFESLDRENYLQCLCHFTKNYFLPIETSQSICTGLYVMGIQIVAKKILNNFNATSETTISIPVKIVGAFVRAMNSLLKCRTF